jgi:formylglycine-generating enzyme required for sulfatase activity
MHAPLTLLLAGVCCLVACHYTRIGTNSSDDVFAEARFQFAAGAHAGDERAIGGVKLCWCPAGSFRMGSPADEPGRRSDEAQVDVTLSGFWMGKYEVTQR